MQPKGGMSYLSRSKAEQKRQNRALELARAYDMGRLASDTVTKLVDSFFEEKVVPVARKIDSAFERQMERHHHDRNTDDAMALRINHSARLKELKRHALNGVWHSLSKWKHTLVEAGMKESFDLYIAHKFDPIWDELEKNATEQMTYCAARIAENAKRRAAFDLSQDEDSGGDRPSVY
jgi:hypothetical protein